MDRPVLYGVLFVIAGYLLGSISFAVLVAKRAGVDIRAEGSKNPGATNVGRVLGKSKGRMVLVLDALKGAVPVFAARVVLGEEHSLAMAFVAGTAVAATLGHIAPIYHRFHGGKGAATAAGAILAAVPIAGVAAVLTYIVLKKLSHKASVGSIGGALAGATATTLLVDTHALWVMGWSIFTLVLLRHHKNLRRLWNRKEPET